MPALYIVTGTSRGLGAALAVQLRDRGVELLCLSRGRNVALDMDGGDGRVRQWSVDLADAVAVAEQVRSWLLKRGPEGVDGIVLINNAALLEPPGAFASQSVGTITQALRVGLEAPLLLCRAVLLAAAEWNRPCRLLNVSSGLGQRPLAGVATYCAVKAGLDHYSRTLAQELRESGSASRVVALAPGIIDTGMQVQLRSADASAFAAQSVFAGFKADGALDSPERAAEKMLAFLDRPDFGDDAVADLRAD